MPNPAGPLSFPEQIVIAVIAASGTTLAGAWAFVKFIWRTPQRHQRREQQMTEWWEERMPALTAEIDRLTESNTELRGEVRRLTRANSTLEQRIAEIEAETKQRLAEMDGANRAQLDEIRHTYEESVRALEARFAAEATTERERHAAELARLTEKSAQDADEMESRYEAQIDRLRKELLAANAALLPGVVRPANDPPLEEVIA